MTGYLLTPEPSVQGSGLPFTRYLNAGVTVVGRDYSVLGEHEVDRPARLPPLHVHGDRGVGLGVPLGDLLKPVHHVPCVSNRI